jgi:hypothetical protein
MSEERPTKSRWPHWSELLYGEAAGNSRRDLWRWWRARRLRYNALVGIAGFVTWWIVLIAGSAAVKPGVDFEEPFAMILGPPVYALMANLCYTLGPLVNIVQGDRKPNRRLFQAGLFFSLALTALPGIWAAYCWIHSLVTGQKMD